MHQPTFVNLIRDPISWFQSHYTFMRFGMNKGRAEDAPKLGSVSWFQYLTRGGNNIGVFIHTKRVLYLQYRQTSLNKTLQETSDNIYGHYETIFICQSFFVFEL